MRTIDSLGRRSRWEAKTSEERFWSHVDILENAAACWLWTGASSPLGYGRFNVKKRARVASRVAWELKNGPTDLHILHRCDNPACVNPDHLFPGTDADNIHDCMAKGRFKPRTLCGEAQVQAKLTDDAVREIRSSRGIPQVLLAKRYGVSQGVISRVVLGKGWKHVA